MLTNLVSYEILVGEIIAILSLIGFFAFFRKPGISNFQINLDSDIFSSSNVAPGLNVSKWRFHIVGPCTQMIEAYRDGAIKDALRTRKIPVSFQIGGRQITLIVDARNYDESGDRMYGILSIFKADQCADLWRSFSEVQRLFPSQNAHLNPSQTLSGVNSRDSDQDS